MTKQDKAFKLEHQYQLYLQRVALSEDKMHPQQKHQLRQAFMGCAGQMIILLRDDLAQLSEDDGVEGLLRQRAVAGSSDHEAGEGEERGLGSSPACGGSGPKPKARLDGGA